MAFYGLNARFNEMYSGVHYFEGVHWSHPHYNNFSIKTDISS